MFSNELVCQIIDYLNNNLLSEIRIDDLSKKFYFNRTYIMKKFKKELGISIINYLNTKRIEYSLRFFRDKKSILEIALKSNFNSQEYYEEIFKMVIGVRPLIYKKYINNIVLFNDKEKILIQNSINNLNNLNILVTKYLNNRKPVKMVKKLSLFK